MSALRSYLAGIVVVTAGSASGLLVSELSYDQLVSFVMFENEEAYRDPTGYFCKFIRLKDKDDYCKASLTSLDPKLCRIEVTREFLATYESGGVKGRDYMKSRDVFLLSALDLAKAGAPEIDKEHKTTRQTFEAAIDVHHAERTQYSKLLDEAGHYRACRIDGVEKSLPEPECERAGTQPAASSKTMALLFNSENYRRAMEALSFLQKSYCTSVGDEL